MWALEIPPAPITPILTVRISLRSWLLSPDAGRVLGAVPQRACRPRDKDREPSVRVAAHHRVAGESAAQRLPARPSRGRRQLPYVPESVIRAAREHLQATVRVLPHRGIARQRASKRCPRGPRTDARAHLRPGVE